MGGSSSKVAGGAQVAKRKLPTTVSSASSVNQRPPIPPRSTSPPSTESRSPPPNYHTSYSQSQSQPIPGPTVHPSPAKSSSQPSASRNEFIDLDARDPTFNSNLRSIGPVQPVPTASNTSTFVPYSSKPDTYPSSHGTAQIFPTASMNPALAVLKARETVAKRIELEQEQMGRKGFAGRTIVDVATLGAIVRAREGRDVKGDEDLERRWRLKTGILHEKLGEKGNVWGSVS